MKAKLIINPFLSLLIITSFHQTSLSANGALQTYQKSIPTNSGLSSNSDHVQYYKKTKLGIPGEIKVSLQNLLEYNSKIQMGICSTNTELINLDQFLNRKISAISSTIESNISTLQDFEGYYRNQKIIGGVNDALLITAASAGMAAAVTMIGGTSTVLALCGTPIFGAGCGFTIGLGPILATLTIGTTFTDMPLAEKPMTAEPNSNILLTSTQAIKNRIQTVRNFEVNFQNQVEETFSKNIREYERTMNDEGLTNYLKRILAASHFSEKYVSAAFSRAVSTEMLRLYLVAEYIDLRNQTVRLCNK